MVLGSVAPNTSGAYRTGDVFFARQAEMTFDGVFSLAPHPMVRASSRLWADRRSTASAVRVAELPSLIPADAGYYGLSLVVASHTVLIVSMLAHACQFAFLVLFETPRASTSPLPD